MNRHERSDAEQRDTVPSDRKWKSLSDRTAEISVRNLSGYDSLPLIDNRWIQDGEILHNQENPTLRVELGPGGISLRSTKGAELNWYLEGARPCTPRAEKQEEKEELDRISASAVYEDILPGADLRCAVSGVHFKDELVFRTPEGAGKTSFVLNVRGLCVKQDQEDILLTDEAGETVFILPAPVCTDSSKEAEPIQLSWKMEETAQADTWCLICRIPEEWLKSAVYPVILDPAVVTYNARCAIEDAYTCSKQPGTTHRGSSSNILRLTQNSSNWGQCAGCIGLYCLCRVPCIHSTGRISHQCLYRNPAGSARQLDTGNPDP